MLWINLQQLDMSRCLPVEVDYKSLTRATFREPGLARSATRPVGRPARLQLMMDVSLTCVRTAATVLWVLVSNRLQLEIITFEKIIVNFDNRDDVGRATS